MLYTRMHQLVLLRTTSAAEMNNEYFKALRSPAAAPWPQLLIPQCVQGAPTWGAPLLLSLLTYLQSPQVVWAPAA